MNQRPRRTRNRNLLKAYLDKRKANRDTNTRRVKNSPLGSAADRAKQGRNQSKAPGTGKVDVPLLLVFFGCLGVLFLIVVFAWSIIHTNALPYLEISENIVTKEIPGLSLQASINWTGWAMMIILNAGELIPPFVCANPRFIIAIINGTNSLLKSLPFTPSTDNPILMALGEKYKDQYTDLVLILSIAPILFYFVDLAVTLWHFPPINGGLETLKLLWHTRNPEHIEWGQLFYALFAVGMLDVILYIGYQCFRVAKVTNQFGRSAAE